MFHEVSLIFGYDGYSGDVVVSPESMLIFLQRPFREWLNQSNWENCGISGWEEEDFNRYVYQSTSHFNDEDFCFDLYNAKWLGFRISLLEKDATAKLVFTTEQISGEIRQDLDSFGSGLSKKLMIAKSCINEILEEIIFRAE